MKLQVLSFARIVSTIFLVLYGAIVVPLLHGILRTGAAISTFEMSILLPFLCILAAMFLLAWYIRRQKKVQNIQPFYARLSLPLNQVIKWVALAIPLVLLPLLLLGLNFLVNGSMELYPTAEQQDKAKLVGFVLTYFWSAIAIACLSFFLKISAYIRRNKESA